MTQKQKKKTWSCYTEDQKGVIIAVDYKLDNEFRDL